MADFSRLELTAADDNFRREVDDFFATYVTDAEHEHERRTGDGFHEQLHLEMGKRGWILPTWPREEGGAGLDRTRHRILQIAKQRTGLLFTTLDTTNVVAQVIRRYGDPGVRDDLLRGTAEGRIRFCLGYTEPEGGSDIAAARTRADRCGSGWRINGSKMFTTGAHNCQYSFTVVRTNSAAPKHHGLTMFCVPLQVPEVAIQAVRTFGGERTNIVYFADTPVEDVLRLGPVDGGWAVLHDPLDREHSMAADAVDDGLDPPSVRTDYAVLLSRCVDAAARWAATTVLADGSRPADHEAVLVQLGRIAIDAEVALNAPGHLGRVKATTSLIDGSAALLDLVGTPGALPYGSDGAIEDGLLEYAHRFAQGTATYGGTVEVFRNIIAERDLMLPRG